MTFFKCRLKYLETKETIEIMRLFQFQFSILILKLYYHGTVKVSKIVQELILKEDTKQE